MESLAGASSCLDANSAASWTIAEIMPRVRAPLADWLGMEKGEDFWVALRVTDCGVVRSGREANWRAKERAKPNLPTAIGVGR